MSRERESFLKNREKGRLSHLFGKIAEEKGFAIERRVAEVMWDYIGSPECPYWLVGYLPANPQQDSRGIDGIFLTSDVGEICVQIKSSLQGVRKAHLNHPDIPIICVQSLALSDGEIAQICLEVVGREREKFLALRCAFNNF